ncbi:PREDICTED: SET domain-containing protein 9-like [Branchiostoma belcheri]|uniref:SET domain-containing protein 9-like n=1 Tax=Branchiostoma belcheri TaxID=7741 RepID=A0A6P5AFW0_BRABE|nr:PREDICTED: SET domain-containing protein 9-like [Branchiostoma belcheri]
MGGWVRRLRARWQAYRYRFVPWIAVNLKDRKVRSVPKGTQDKIIPDSAVLSTLVMLKTLGFCTERKESSLVGAGRGVFVTRGTVPAKTVVSMYPGTMYYPFEPILLQSIANPFVFRCIDGVFIDGNDCRISKMIYRSCAGRDRIGPYLTCDRSWLTQYPKNPLAVGQYVNNQSAGHPANVAYQEYNIQVDFPFTLRKYLPNIHYSPNLQTAGDASYRSLRVVVLVSLRDIQAGEELFSSYFTLVE